MNIINARVESLRRAMADAGLDGWIINGTDPHQSEYVPERYRSRAFISGFTGSAGLALITKEKALLWVDSRYFLQAEDQIAGTVFEMMKIDTPSHPDPYTYLKMNLPKGSVIGIDEATIPVSERRRIEGVFQNTLVLKPMKDILDAVWTDRPVLPEHEVVEVPVNYAGIVDGNLDDLMLRQHRAIGPDGIKDILHRFEDEGVLKNSFDPPPFADGDRRLVDPDDRSLGEVHLQIGVRIGMGGSVDLHHLEDRAGDLILRLKKVSRIHPKKRFFLGDQGQSGTAGEPADERPASISFGDVFALMGIGSVDDPAIKSGIGHRPPKAFDPCIDDIHCLVLL